MEIKKVTKGEFVQKPNELKHKIIHVITGLLRMYLVDDDGKEHIYMFAPEGWTLSDFAALAESKKSIFYIDAIENSQIEIITKGVDEKIPRTLDEYTDQTIEMMGRRIAIWDNPNIRYEKGWELVDKPALEWHIKSPPFYQPERYVTDFCVAIK